jgi:signal transduction histidine kinase
MQTAVYRLVQECCHNIAKHAGASRVNLSLGASDKWLELRVTDNGAGFDVEAALRKPECFGLAGMRERAGILGGSLEIKSRRGRGTSVVARLPRPRASMKTAEREDGKDTSDVDG